MHNPFEPENLNPQIEAVVALLPSRVRPKAHAALSEGGAKKIQLLSRVVAKERAKRRTIARFTSLPGALVLIASLGIALRFRTFGLYTAGLTLSGFVMLALAATTWFPSRLEKAAQAALMESEEPESLGPLLEGLQSRVPVLRAQARAQLLRLLPLATPETLLRLTPTQQHALYGTLNFTHNRPDRELRLSVLAALQEAGDKSCLGAVYQLTTEEAITDTELAVREAAKACIEHLYARLDFGPLTDLPRYIDSLGVHLRAEKMDFQDYAASLLAVTQLLPQLTPANYGSILSANHRNHLYGLLVLYATAGSGLYRYRRRDLHLAIIRTAERLNETRAIDALQEYAESTMAKADEEIYFGLCQLVDTLEIQIEQKKGRAAPGRGVSAPLQGTEEHTR